VPKTIENGRPNQRHRTRKDLLAAAGRLLKQGQAPDMDAVAAEAMVSRATAYRYFPSIEALLVEAPLEGAAPSPDEIFNDRSGDDPVARVDAAEAAMHAMSYRNEAQLRRMLIASLQRSLQQGSNGEKDRIPIRQNRRAGLIEAALAPARGRFTKASYERLSAALALIVGTESMIVFNDVLGLDEKAARKTKSWAIKALIEAALRDRDRK
jgi:AcrR family transcriptional regulator